MKKRRSRCASGRYARYQVDGTREDDRPRRTAKDERSRANASGRAECGGGTEGQTAERRAEGAEVGRNRKRQADIGGHEAQGSTALRMTAPLPRLDDGRRRGFNTRLRSGRQVAFRGQVAG